MKKPLDWPAAAEKLWAAIAAKTSAGETLRPAMRTGSSHTRIAKVWPPRISAEATPSTGGSTGGRDVTPPHANVMEPHPHRESLAAQNIGGSNSIDGRQHRLNHPRQIVRDRRSRQHLGRKAEIHHRRGLTGGLGHDRIVRFLWNEIFDRIHLG